MRAMLIGKEKKDKEGMTKVHGRWLAQPPPLHPETKFSWSLVDQIG